MCSGSKILFKIKRLIVGENRSFLGAEDWMKHHGIEVIVLDDARCV
jgi:cytosine deaminase